MAIAYVRDTDDSAESDTITLSINVSAGTNRVLVFGIAYRNNSVQAVTSLHFNGTENFTQELSAADGVDAQCHLYYLVAPTVTTANVVCTLAASSRLCAYVAYFTGVDQTNPFTAATSEANGTNDAPTTSVISTSDDMCVDIMCQVSAGPDTATPSHNVMMNRAQTGGGTDCRGCGQYVVGNAPTRTMDYSMSDSDNWNIIAGALQEPQPATGWGHCLSTHRNRLVYGG
jgi:hypothetical protein